MLHGSVFLKNALNRFFYALFWIDSHYLYWIFIKSM